ncbi:membrane protein insertase YidC [Fervidobacterium sp. 2310opik-2]|uniref:membrane protein insertase YidC n=1 Tax=Fervidobacterium sp. 2310opik-2 TaxID=1755815 RepID=UPI0016AB05F9|nr:membrane protein insertase YidC [Fervidobacterium sp. 2310opik-2]KAF2962080.1 preprotein translocase YidC [Fervidobacterium sp. 2310opik-2]
MKKSTVVFLLFVLLGILIRGVGFSSIFVEERVDSIVVTSKYLQIEIGKDGNLSKVSHLLGRAFLFYVNDNDGFDIYNENNIEISEGTPTYTINYGEKAEKDSYKSLQITFDYPNRLKKTYIFDDKLITYSYKVKIESPDSVKIALPLIWSNDTVRSAMNFFVSFRPDKDYASIVKFSGKLDGTKVVGNSLEFFVYMGPYKKTVLKHVFGEDSGRLIELIKTIPGVGTWYSFIADGLTEFFNWINTFTRNFGLTIIVFTIIVRLILYPFYHAQTKQMIQMRKLQPAVEAIKKKYKDPQKQQEELMKLYKENKINPSSGCLMLLIQLPIFMLLYGVIQSYQELFSVSGGFLIWKDLSAGGWGANWLFLIITILTSYYLALITSQDSRTAWQQIIMGAIFPFFFINLPSGIFLYWTMNSIIQLVITFYIYKRYKIQGLTQHELWGIRPKKK